VTGAEAGALGIVVAAVVGLMGVLYTTRQGASAARTASEMTDRAEIVDDYRTWAQDSKTRMEKLEARLEATSRRVEELEKQRQRDQRMIRSALAYIRDLVALLHSHGIDPPPTPVDIDLFDDR
jgi:uncharacterized protein HemX